MHNYSRPSLSKEDLHDTIVANSKYALEQYTKHDLPLIKGRANLTDKFPDAEKVGDYLASLGFVSLGIGTIEPLPHDDCSPLALDEDQVDENHERAWKLLLRALDKVKNGKRLTRFEAKRFREASRPPEPRPLMGITCGVGRNTNIVDREGYVYPCHRYAGMEAYRLGNIMLHGLDHQAMMDYYQKVNRHAVEHCARCWIRDYCRGGCPWVLSDSAGIVHDPRDRECRRRRSAMERTLWLRKELRKALPDRFKDGSEIPIDEWDWEHEIESPAHAAETERAGGELKAGGQQKLAAKSQVAGSVP